jgi:uracil-DNA glycosylase
MSESLYQQWVQLKKFEMEPKIKAYLKDTWFNYKGKIGLEPYNYLYGNPIKVHVPIDITIGGLMIVGAYPTAHFHTLKAPNGKLITKVPIGDHLYPFSNEMYFDGSGIDRVKSGKEIEEYFLKHLGISRDKCWITDLVKVFLFKQGHIDRYNKLGYTNFKANRDEFLNLAKLSLPYLYKEVELAKPKVVICLGAEVNAVIHEKSVKEATQLITKNPIFKTINGESIPFFACPHPGILMREDERSDKWRAILNETLIEVNKYL